jgi:hypothetical protein
MPVLHGKALCLVQSILNVVQRSEWLPGGWLPDGWLPGGWLPGGWLPGAHLR